MEGDFIKVSKSQNLNEFILEVYFSSVNSTVKIQIAEADFLKLILEAGKLYNENSTFFKLNFSESDITDLIKRIREKRVHKQVFMSLDIPDKKSKDTEYIPLKYKPEVEVIIYVSDNFISLSEAEKITNTCGNFMEALGFELEMEDEPVFGSFFKKLKFIFSSTIGDEDLIKLYERGKKALELRHIELPTAEQTEKLASAAEKLVKSLDGIEEGVIRCGGLIVLKKYVDGKQKLIIQQLSTELIIILDKHPQLLFNVNTIYELLTGDVKKDINDSDSNTVLIA